MSEDFLPLHGGNIQAASDYYGIEKHLWIDLSTGVNPQCYPVGTLPTNVFTDLPYVRDDFLQAVKKYYCTHVNNDWCLQPTPGTQFAIETLPHLLVPKPVLLPALGYKEHQIHWMTSGATLSFYSSLEMQVAVDEINNAIKYNADQHLVLVNPNNPTGICFSQAQIQQWSDALADDAYIIVDEAFVDVEPENSLLCDALLDNVIVLRSFGKFFGLAGLRLGAVFANQYVIDQIAERLGLWQINGPAQAIAINALNDVRWHNHAKQNIKALRQMTEDIFAPLITAFNARQLNADTLFISIALSEQQALDVAHFFATRGILLRVFILENKHALLRIGLVNSHDDILLRVKAARDDYLKQSTLV